MDLKKDIVEQARDISDINLVDPRDIPKIDLYMEQVTSFLEQEMGESFRFHDECVFTGTMINNYTKAGVLPRPENKRYSRRHVLTLIFIYLLKQSLSIPEIKRFTGLIGDQEKLENMYALFRDLLEDCAQEYVRSIGDKLDMIDRKFEERGVEDEEMKALIFISPISLDATVSTKLSNRVLTLLEEKRENERKAEEERKKAEEEEKKRQQEEQKRQEEEEKKRREEQEKQEKEAREREKKEREKEEKEHREQEKKSS